MLAAQRFRNNTSDQCWKVVPCDKLNDREPRTLAKQSCEVRLAAPSSRLQFAHVQTGSMLIHKTTKKVVKRPSLTSSNHQIWNTRLKQKPMRHSLKGFLSAVIFNKNIFKRILHVQKIYTRQTRTLLSIQWLFNHQTYLIHCSLHTLTAHVEINQWRVQTSGLCVGLLDHTQKSAGRRDTGGPFMDTKVTVKNSRCKLCLRGFAATEGVG